jgi:SAM-dependent methyltransferase
VPSPHTFVRTRSGAPTAALVSALIAAVVGAWGSRRSSDDDRWGMTITPDLLEPAECFRCGTDGDPVHDMDPFAVVRCPECGQTFVNPRLNEAGRLALYGDAAYFDEGVYATPRASALQRAWIGGRLDLIGRYLEPEGGRVFEAGCAYGLFLDEARRRGFGVAGLELSPVAAETASRLLGVEVIQGEVVDLDRDDDFDAMVFWDTIEHVPDPAAFIAATRRMVRPGGIVALSCPYYDSIPARLLGTRWWTIKPHKHIWHFTTDGMRRLLDEHGMTVLEVVRNPLRRANLARVDSMVVVARRT